jgi:hypothetical protein
MRSFVHQFMSCLLVGSSFVNCNLKALEPLDTGIKRPTLERYQREHLEKTHTDAAKIRENRREIQPPAGWQDIRAIFHAHAEDSEHTGGTRPEMIADAKKAGVKALFLSDHYRPPRDFVTPERSGLVDGILLVPGSEWAGFLIHPVKSVMEQMKSPAEVLLKAVRADGGFAYLSHVEERQDHAMDQLDGMEIYNRHYDAIVDRKGFIQLFLNLTAEESLRDFQEKLRLFPDETFAFEVEYPKLYLNKWDRELLKKRLTGVAANDCHHNMVMIVKKVDDTNVLVGTVVDKDEQMRKIPVGLAPGIKELVKGKKPGEVIASVDLDPYQRSFASSSTHIFAKELTDSALRDALKNGRAYVSHDWICDPAGFWIDILNDSNEKTGMIGDEISFAKAKPKKFRITLPAAAWVRLVRNGEVVAEQRDQNEVEFQINQPGVYRVEVFQILDDEARGWIYANPIYIRD